MPTKNLTCYTIGYANYASPSFIATLKNYNINYLIDVRTTAYSQRYPQFNKEILEAALKKENIVYLFMGDLIGGRYTDSNLLFSDGQVNFKKVRETANFKLGIEQILKGLDKNHVIALMCAEKDPLNCHRFVLISYELKKNGVSVEHILDTNTIISNQTVEETLLKKYSKNLGQSSLFEPTPTRQELLETAYEKRNKEIAYIHKPAEKIN